MIHNKQVTVLVSHFAPCEKLLLLGRKLLAGTVHCRDIHEGMFPSCIFCAILHRVVIGRNNIAERYAGDIDTVPVICYPTNRTTLLKLSGRYCKPDTAKKRNGSIFICIYNFATPDKVLGVLFCICAVDLLHIINKESFFVRTQIQYCKQWLPIVRFHGSDYHHSAVTAGFSVSLAAQNQNRVFKYLGDFLYCAVANLRVVFLYNI